MTTPTPEQSAVPDIVVRLREKAAMRATYGSTTGVMRLAADIIERATEVGKQMRAEIEQLRAVLEGIPQDAIDGGWTAMGLDRCAKALADENKVLRAELNTRAAPKWTSDLPVVPGWYWLKLPDDRGVEVVQVWKWDINNGQLMFSSHHIESWKHDGCLWQGPLPPPGEG